MFTLNVTVDFYAVPIEYAPVEFVAKTLRNGTTDRYESSEYVAGDPLRYVVQLLKLAILQCSSRTATQWCASCHISVMTICRFVGKDKRHIFFENDENGYQMTCGEEQEINCVHVVFSPNPFINADLMRTMTRRKF